MNEPQLHGVRSIRIRAGVIWAVLLLVIIHVMPLVADTSSNTVTTAVFVGTCIALYSTWGFWLGFGENWWRIIGVTVLANLVTVVLIFGTGGPIRWKGFLLLSLLGGIVIAIVATPIVAIRHLRCGSLRVVVHDKEYRTDAIRFGITQMLAFTTCIAVLIVIAKVIVPLFDLAVDNWQLVARLGATLGCCSIIVIWSALGKNAFARTLASTLCGAALAALNYWFVEDRRGMLWVTVTVVVWIETMILMWLVRLEGYRFVSVPPITPKTVKQSVNGHVGAPVD